MQPSLKAISVPILLLTLPSGYWSPGPAPRSPGGPAAHYDYIRRHLIIACRSLEQFIALEPYRDKAPDYLGILSRDELGEGKQCELLRDFESVARRNLYHVEKADGNYICVRLVNKPDCRWTKLDWLSYIARGPQLSSEEFARVERLYVEIDLARGAKRGYEDKLYELNKSNQLDREDELRIGERQALRGLLDEVDRRINELTQQAETVGKP